MVHQEFGYSINNGKKSAVECVSPSNHPSSRCSSIAKPIPNTLHCTVNVLRRSLPPPKCKIKIRAHELPRTVRRRPILNVLLYIGSGSISWGRFLWVFDAPLSIARPPSAGKRKSDDGASDRGDCRTYHFCIMQRHSKTHRGCGVPTHIALHGVDQGGHILVGGVSPVLHEEKGDVLGDGSPRKASRRWPSR